jgi:hypothetical protein
MDSLKYKIEVITTYERIEEAVKLYSDTANKFNPFIAALGVDPETLYNETIKPKIQTIADQGLSVGMYNEANNELISANIVVDATTEFNIELTSPILKARAAMFKEGKDKILKNQKIPKFGELVEVMFAVTRPTYMNMNLYKFVDEATVKHHIAKGYEYRYAEITVPITQYLFEMLEVPFTCLRFYYKHYEYQGEKIFEKMDFGDGYKNGKPCVMFYYLRNDDYFEGGEQMIARLKSAKKPEKKTE